METDLNSTAMRDLFAMFALAGMLAEKPRPLGEEAARYAYVYADAMMEERNKDAT